MRKVLVALLLAACGDSDGGIPFEELDVFANDRRCSRLTRCGLFDSVSTCATFFRKDPRVNLRAAIERDIVDYDGASAERCELALAAVGCNGVERDARVLPDACTKVLRGKRATGATCAIDEECTSGFCDGPGCPEGQCCTGTCRDQRFAKLSDACGVDQDCVAETYCGPELTCQPLVPAGGECRADKHCEYSLGCIGANEFMPGTCRKLPLLGESCPYMRCAELGAQCRDGKCVVIGLTGAPCLGDLDCSPFYQCGAEQTCVRLPSLGEACVARCAGESSCNIETGICEAPRANGEMCSAGDQCLSLVCVDGPVFETCIAEPICVP